jgi:sulfate permease, SulP family
MTAVRRAREPVEAKGPAAYAALDVLEEPVRPPSARDLRKDALAALPGAVGSVPDGMAAGVLAGINPIHGIYASIAGPVAGGLTAGTQLMAVTTTSAAALATGSAVAGVDADERGSAVALLTLIAGALMVGAGIARLGRYTHFVAHSVMIGFLTGVAVNIVLGQLPDLLGASAEGPFALAKAADVVLHPGRIDLASALTGAGALVLLVLAARFGLTSVGALLALVLPTLGLAAAGATGVARVEDSGAIPGGFPTPALPDLGAVTPALLTGAAAVAAIVLVQGAGVRESAPNPSGRAASVDRDFLAQGAGNLAAGLLRGMPVGGSVGQTAMNVAAGARSRWVNVLSGLWLLLIVVAVAGIVGRVPLPTLAAVLVFAAAGSLRLPDILTITRTSSQSAVALVATFVATLLLPVAIAVGVGVALSLMLQLNREAVDLRVVELQPLGDERFLERPVPAVLADHGVTLLEVYGSLLFAGARTLQLLLPDPAGSEGAAVVVRLRGRVSLGATFAVVISDYAHRLDAAGGRLFLSGLDPALHSQLARTGALPSGAFDASPLLGESTSQAYAAAQDWASASAPE